MNIISKLLSQSTKENEQEINNKKSERVVIKVIKPKEPNYNIDNFSDKNELESVQQNQSDYKEEKEIIDQSSLINEIKNERKKEEGVKLLNFDSNINFDELYSKADIKSTNDNIERVIDTIEKMSKLIPNGQIDVVRAAVRTTLETTGFNVNNIKEDGNNKITAVKKYREFIDGEVNRYINDRKNSIAELEKQIEQYKMDIQDKKSMLLIKNKQIENEIQQMSYAIEFLSIEENKEQV